VGLKLLADKLHGRYHLEERRHACAILETDFPDALKDIIECLDAFELLRGENPL